jgi:hypothetical protein
VALEQFLDAVDAPPRSLVVATSPLAALQDAILMVNSDLFTTGTRSLERTDVPDVLDGLAGSCSAAIPRRIRGNSSSFSSPGTSKSWTASGRTTKRSSAT